MEYLIQEYLKSHNVTAINGVDYEIRDNLDERGVYISKWDIDIEQPSFSKEDIMRADKFLINMSKRINEYGSITQQMENIIENGLAAEQERVLTIKSKYPKE
jgi:hypothetical protein